MSRATEGKRRRGRPKTTWRGTVEKERQEAGWRLWEEVRAAATNQEEWKRSVKAQSMCHEARRGYARCEQDYI